MAAIRKNSTPIYPKMTWRTIGTFPSSFGPIKESSFGSNVGSSENNNQNGNKYNEESTAKKRIQRIKVPTAGVCLYSSACSKWSDRKSTRLNSSHVATSYAV